MKKFIVLTLAMTMTMTTFALANSPTKPNYNTTATAVTPSIAVDRDTLEELVMARPYAESIGYTVTWNPDEKSTTFTKGQNVFKATVGSNVYIANGEEVVLETETQLIDEKTYIPASFQKMLFDVPVIDPSKPDTITPEIPADRTNPDTITPEIPVIEDPTDSIETIDNTVDPIMTLEVAQKIEATLSESYEDLSYDVISHNDDYISLKMSSDGNYITFDIKTGDVVTLETLLGDDYATVVKDQVVTTAKEREELNPRGYDYSDELLENLVIDENTSFYFNENGELIVTFPKSEIASGAVATTDFIIE